MMWRDTMCVNCKEMVVTLGKGSNTLYIRKRSNVIKIYMYSLYVYTARRLQLKHLSRYRATTSGLKNNVFI